MANYSPAWKKPFAERKPHRSCRLKLSRNGIANFNTERIALLNFNSSVPSRLAERYTNLSEFTNYSSIMESMRSQQNVLRGFLLILGVLVTPKLAYAQSIVESSPAASSSLVSERTLPLSSDSATNSQLAALRGDLIAAITQGASPAETAALIQRQRQVDQRLQEELGAIRSELVAIQMADFNRESQRRRAGLRRRESLLWLTRVELAAMLPEMFAEHAADCAAFSEQTIRLIGEAIAKFPNRSELNGELSRLLSEAQLRSGDADAAMKTMQQASMREIREADSQAATTSAAGTEATLVIETSDQLAFVIRVDIAKHRWEAAEDKLQQYFGAQPAAAPPSPAMDLARLRYLIARPAQSPNLLEIGQWLDAIQTRGGATARRNAETLLARDRESHREMASLPESDRDSSASLVDSAKLDPRVLRADARYYLRVGKTLPAAITFARAAVADSEASRGIESAIQSAAILQSISKESAAAELLRRIALTHRQQESSPMLMLQAAALQSESDREATSNDTTANPSSDHPVTAREILFELIAEWPTSAAAQSARSTLIDSAIAAGDSLSAAVLATQMPAEHWGKETAIRCRQLWQHAIAGKKPLNSPCRWDDEVCRSNHAAELAERLGTMRSTFAAASTSPIAAQTNCICTILLDSCADVSGRDRLEWALPKVADSAFKQLAQRRLGMEVHSAAPEITSSVDSAVDSEISDAVIWRLNHDLLENPTRRRSLATYLLAMIDEAGIDVDPRLHVAWLLASGKIADGNQLLREKLAISKQPAELLAAAAGALAASREPDEWIRASHLWQELAAGIPSSEPSHHRAKVESIDCLWRSGNRRDARTAAELMLLTNPPHDTKLAEQLKEWAR